MRDTTIQLSSRGERGNVAEGRVLSHLLGDGLAVQLVVDLPDLGHGEGQHGEGVQAERDLLLRHQRHRAGRTRLHLRVFTCGGESGMSVWGHWSSGWGCGGIQCSVGCG